MKESKDLQYKSGGQKDSQSQEIIQSQNNALKDINSDENQTNSRWINNEGEAVEEVFGFNENAELVNGRAAMCGFLMLILTELVFKGEPASKSIFGIG